MRCTKHTLLLISVLTFSFCKPQNDQGALPHSQKSADDILLKPTLNKNDMVEKILYLLEERKNRQEVLDSFFTQFSGLRQELAGAATSFCPEQNRIQKLEFIVYGRKVKDIEVSKSMYGKEGLTSKEGLSALEFDFYLGNQKLSIKHTKDQFKEPIFNQKAVLNIPVDVSSDDLTAQNLSYLRIRKRHHVHMRTSCIELRSAICMDQPGDTITELMRYELNRLQIKVNDQLIYEHPEIDFVFAHSQAQDENYPSHGIEWRDLAFSDNETYVQFLKSQKCLTQR